MASGSDKVELSNVFVWANVGKKLEELDKKRLLCLAHQNPNHNLSIITNIEVDKIIKELFENKEFPDFNNDIQKQILDLNNADNTFREVAKFMRYKQDMLSIGSTITGQIQNQRLPMRFDYGQDDD